MCISHQFRTVYYPIRVNFYNSIFMITHEEKETILLLDQGLSHKTISQVLLKVKKLTEKNILHQCIILYKL